MTGLPLPASGVFKNCGPVTARTACTCRWPAPGRGRARAQPSLHDHVALAAGLAPSTRLSSSFHRAAPGTTGLCGYRRCARPPAPPARWPPPPHSRPSGQAPQSRSPSGTNLGLLMFRLYVTGPCTTTSRREGRVGPASRTAGGSWSALIHLQTQIITSNAASVHHRVRTENTAGPPASTTSESCEMTATSMELRGAGGTPERQDARDAVSAGRLEQKCSDAAPCRRRRPPLTPQEQALACHFVKC